MTSFVCISIFKINATLLFSIALLFLIIWLTTKDGPVSPISETIVGVFNWLGFTIFGEADLNGRFRTGLINAGVTWSLPYEWFFYIALPIIALFVGIRPR